MSESEGEPIDSVIAPPSKKSHNSVTSVFISSYAHTPHAPHRTRTGGE
jgi:hypothetical protein